MPHAMVQLPDLPRLLRQLASGVVLLQPDLRVVGDVLEIPAGRGSTLRVTSRAGEAVTFAADDEGVIRASRADLAVARDVVLCRVRRGRFRCRRVDLPRL